MKKLLKFLGTFASQGPTTMRPSYVGIQPVFSEYELTSALAAGQTLTLQVPDGLDVGVGAPAAGQPRVGWIPFAFRILSNADPQLPQQDPDVATTLVLTSYDRDTGRAVFTAGAAGVADSSVIVVMWVASTLGTT